MFILFTLPSARNHGELDDVPYFGHSVGADYFWPAKSDVQMKLSVKRVAISNHHSQLFAGFAKAQIRFFFRRETILPFLRFSAVLRSILIFVLRQGDFCTTDGVSEQDWINQYYTWI